MTRSITALLLLLSVALVACTPTMVTPGPTNATFGASEPPASPSAVPSASVAPLTSALPDASAAGAAVPNAQPAETSAPITLPSAASPTPTPDPAVWRYEGVVVDDKGDPLPGVCIVIGPRGCQRFSPHTDEHGTYYFDVPQIPTVTYDLTFLKDGFGPVFHRAQPSGPTIFNVVLAKQ